MSSEFEPILIDFFVDGDNANGGGGSLKEPQTIVELASAKNFDGGFAVRLKSAHPGLQPLPPGLFQIPDDFPTADGFKPIAGHFVLAFSRVCTHMGCHLFRSMNDHNIVHKPNQSPPSLTCGPCPCHGTVFDLYKAGLVVLGPATQNLAQLQIMVQDNEGLQLFASDWLVDPAPSSREPIF